jgi:glycosyltransferase involved in cell wall biosynthesis
MACGLPVLVSNRCGCARELVHEGENGYAFDPGSTSAITECMARLAGQENLLARMGGASAEIVRRFHVSAFAEGLAAGTAAALAARSGRGYFPYWPKLGALFGRVAAADDTR